MHLPMPERESRQPYEHAGKNFMIISGSYKKQVIRIEDWWQNLFGKSWMDADGNPAALKYAIRVAMEKLPMNNEVLYGKVGGSGHLIHVSELGDIVENAGR